VSAFGENCHCSGSWDVATMMGAAAADRRRVVGGNTGLDTGDWRLRARWAGQSPWPKTLSGAGEAGQR
jgi:hypothetical protein